MELPVIRMCAAGASDATIGVNAMLDALTLDGSDTRPAHVTIYNSVDHGFVARRKVPQDGGGIIFPAVAILIPDPVSLYEVRTSVRDGVFPVGFAYLQKASDSASGNRDGLYTNHAIARFLTRFLAPTAPSQALRTRAGVGIIGPSDLQNATRQPPVNIDWLGALVTAITTIDLLVRDTTA